MTDVDPQVAALDDLEAEGITPNPQPHVESESDPYAKVKALIAEEVSAQIDSFREEVAGALSDIANQSAQNDNYILGVLAGAKGEFALPGAGPVNDADVPAP